MAAEGHGGHLGVPVQEDHSNFGLLLFGRACSSVHPLQQKDEAGAQIQPPPPETLINFGFLSCEALKLKIFILKTTKHILLARVLSVVLIFYPRLYFFFLESLFFRHCIFTRLLKHAIKLD